MFFISAIVCLSVHGWTSAFLLDVHKIPWKTTPWPQIGERTDSAIGSFFHWAIMTDPEVMRWDEYGRHREISWEYDSKIAGAVLGVQLGTLSQPLFPGRREASFLGGGRRVLLWIPFLLSTFLGTDSELCVLTLSCAYSHWVVRTHTELCVLTLSCAYSHWVVRSPTNLKFFL